MLLSKINCFEKRVVNWVPTTNANVVEFSSSQNVVNLVCSLTHDPTNLGEHSTDVQSVLEVTTDLDYFGNDLRFLNVDES